MTLKFKIRVSKKTKEGDYSPIYVRLYDGAICDQTVKTRCMVQPHFWDQKGQCIKYRCLCPEQERDTITSELLGIRSYLTSKYNECKQQGKSISDAWVLKTLTQYYKDGGRNAETQAKKKYAFDELFNQFLSVRNLGEGRARHYEVLRRMIHRYESYVRCASGRKRYTFDVVRVDKSVLDSVYDYIENEYEYVQKYEKILQDNPETRDIKPRGENYMSGIFKEVRAFFNWAYKTKIIDSFPFEGFEMPSERYGSPIYLTLEDVQKLYTADLSDDPYLAVQRDIFVFQCNVGCRVGDLLRLKKRDVINGAVEYIPTKTIKENARTVVVPLNSVAQEIVDWYAGLPGDQLLPFDSSERYNVSIKTVFEKAGVTYLVTKFDTVSRTEVKVPINEIASSHMARRTFIGNIYKLVKDPNLVSALTGHVEGSRAFTRYRTIDIDMKKDLVKILEGKQ